MNPTPTATCMTADPPMSLLTITQNGYGKRTPVDEYRVQPEAAKCVRSRAAARAASTSRPSDRNGKSVAALQRPGRATTWSSSPRAASSSAPLRIRSAKSAEEPRASASCPPRWRGISAAVAPEEAPEAPGAPEGATQPAPAPVTPQRSDSKDSSPQRHRGHRAEASRQQGIEASRRKRDCFRWHVFPLDALMPLASMPLLCVLSVLCVLFLYLKNTAAPNWPPRCALGVSLS
jgi:hypothetical protein